ncbi:MAG: hypothetical protein SGJ10_03095 [Bacteroidota bacterium]|nr:hypothetical protein [Bacteroidota bacterium]
MSIYTYVTENFILPFGDMVFKSSVIKNLRQWRKTQWLSVEEIAQLERENLKSLLSHVLKNIPHYKNLNITENEDPFLTLSKFPLLYKKDIKSDFYNFIDPNQDKKTLIKYMSSGSSGVQGEGYVNKAEDSASIAIQTLWWEWAGYRMGKPLIQTGVSLNRGLKKKLKDKLLRVKYELAFNHYEKDIIKLLNKINHTQKYYFAGYASSLFVFSQLAKKQRINDIKLKSVVSFGDKMFPHYRKSIQEVFGAKVYDTYGCCEGIMFSGQCEFGHYHIMSPHVHLEIVDKDGNPVSEGTLGYVVATRLDGYTMPLIRYYMGDMAVKNARNKTCECGRGFPIMEQIIGRDTDIIRTKNGKYLVVHIFTLIFEQYSSIKQFRVIQKVLENIEIEYIPEPDFEKSILSEISSRILLNTEPGELKINYTCVDFIPATPSGKPQIIQSFL